MMKINKLEIENVKRVKAVSLEPAENGLTIIGGNNNQGKTSILDSIAWALGGDRYRPSDAARKGSCIPPHLHIVMNNGLIVERKGKNSDLKVIDPNGQKGGQQLLNDFVEELAINLPKFMEATNKEKGNILLQIIGVGDKLFELEQKEKELYNNRHAIGSIADQKAKFAKEMPYYPNVPQEPVSVYELLQQQQEILARNGENQRKRDRLNEITYEKYRISDEIKRLESQFEELASRIEERKKAYSDIAADEETARKTAANLQDESTAELEENIQNVEDINIKIRSNLDKDKAEADAADYRHQYEEYTAKLNAVRQAKTDLLNNADLPLPGLSVENGSLRYNGFEWDNMSGSDQLKVATAIVRKLKPNCGFVLIDKLEQMDLPTLQEFGKWLETENLQAIATRVSTGDECSIIIEDGYVAEQEIVKQEAKHEIQAVNWKAGEF